MTMRRYAGCLLGAAAVLCSVVNAGPAAAAFGDKIRLIVADRSGTACASINDDGDHRGVGVGVAFDGTSLLMSCYTDSTVTEVDPADGSQIAVHHIGGAQWLGALAWDRGRSLLWACSDFNVVGTIDLSTDLFSPAFQSAGCFDGLAYEARHETIWASADVASTVERYTLTGEFIARHRLGGLIGNCGNSGIAVGSETLYLSNNGCSQIYEVQKDFSGSRLLGDFRARLEDLECDNLTFASTGRSAIWSVDAYDNIVIAWEVPDNSCEFGGGPGSTPPTPTTKAECKNGGWRDYVDDEGQPFRNQGQCVRFVNHLRR